MLKLPRSPFVLLATFLLGSVPAANSQVTLNDAGDYSTNIDGRQSVSVAGGNVNLGDYVLTVGGDNTDTEFFGAMTGNNGGLTKIGSGTFTLSSSNTNWNGDTTINGGTLTVSVTRRIL